MPYTQVIEKTEHEPQEVLVYGPLNQIRERFKAIFKVVSPKEHDDLNERVVNGDDIGVLVMEVTVKLVDFGIPDDVTDAEAITNTVKNSEFANAIWGSFQSLMSRNFDQTRHKSKKRK